MTPPIRNRFMSKSPVARGLLWFAAWMLFGFVAIESIHTAVAGWRGELNQPAIADWLRLLLLPVLGFVYVRYFSIFRPGCRACLPPDSERFRQRP